MSATVFFNSASELATLTNTFSVNGTPAAPTAVTLTVTSPTGVVSTPTPSTASVGVYTADVTCDEDGTWQYLWAGTGTATDAQAGTWDVLETALGKLYCPISTIKSRLNITNNNSDFELHAACFAVSRWIEQYTERIFYRTLSASRTFEPTDCYTVRLPEFCDLLSASSVKTDTGLDGAFATTLSASAYQLLPYNTDAAPEPIPYTKIRLTSGIFPRSYWPTLRRNTVQVTGIWGWSKVPYGIRQGAAILVADTFKLKDAPFGLEGSADFANTVGDNRRAMKFIDPYRRNAVLIA